MDNASQFSNICDKKHERLDREIRELRESVLKLASELDSFKSSFKNHQDRFTVEVQDFYSEIKSIEEKLDSIAGLKNIADLFYEAIKNFNAKIEKIEESFNEFRAYIHDKVVTITSEYVRKSDLTLYASIAGVIFILLKFILSMIGLK